MPDKAIRKEPNRMRNIHHHFWMTAEEEALIRKRMAEMGISNFSSYVRRMLCDGYHITMDLTDIRELTTLLRNCSNDLKQIANRSDETQIIQATDIAILQQRFDSLWDAADKILNGLAKIK